MKSPRTLFFGPVAIALAVAIAGCGANWPPVVDNARDIRALPLSQRNVRARCLRDQDIASLGRLKELSWIDFLGGTKVCELGITDTGLKQLAALHLPKLRTLGIGYSDKISDESIGIISDIRTLQKLIIPSCPRLTGASLKSVANLEHLETLDLGGNQGITDADLAALSEMHELRYLFLGGCYNVTPAGVENLQARMPLCRIRKDDKMWEYSNR